MAQHEFKQGDRVRFINNPPLANLELVATGEYGRVTTVEEDQIGVRLETDHPELADWDNSYFFDLTCPEPSLTVQDEANVWLVPASNDPD